MTEVAFYHLQRSRLEQVLPRLLEKTLGAGKRALVLSGSSDRVEQLNGVLWTYDPATWLPHGCDGDENPADHPVWLSMRDDNVNDASFLFLTDGAGSAAIGEFERCFELFDGDDTDAVQRSRDRWKQYKSDGHDVTYWQQGDQGWAKQGA